MILRTIRRAAGMLSIALGLRTRVGEQWWAERLAEGDEERRKAYAAGHKVYGHLYPSHPVRKGPEEGR